MQVDYKVLSVDQQAAIVRARLADYERRHFELSLDHAVAVAVKDDETVARLDSQLVDLETAYATVLSDEAAVARPQPGAAADGVTP